jgi:hypothetical protein
MLAMLATLVVCEPTTLALYFTLNVKANYARQILVCKQFNMYQTNNSASVIYSLNLSFFNSLQNTLFYMDGKKRASSDSNVSVRYSHKSSPKLFK